MKKILLLASCLTTLSGCTSFSDIGKQRTEIPFKSFPADSGTPAIYLWPPYTSAAIVDDDNNRCILGASGAQTADITAESAAKASQILDKLSGLDASTKKHLVEQFVKISQADSRAAAADVSLFHLCILDQNGTFKDFAKPGDKGPAILDAYRFTVEQAMRMAPFRTSESPADTKSVTAELPVKP